MASRSRRVVVFLGGDPARQAVAHFEAAAGRLGLPVSAIARDPELEPDGIDGELGGAAAVVVVGGEAAAKSFREQFPGHATTALHWGENPDAIGPAVDDLIASLLGGRPTPAAPPAPPPRPAAPRKAATVKVGRETAGRRGKGVTTIWELPLDEAGLKDLVAHLKQRCGTGGTVKDGRIEIQGDQRDRVTAELEKLGYRVKRVGG